MALKSVLILTAGFGEGHNAAANNLAAALRERGVGVEVHDVFEEAYGWVNRLVRRFYLHVINHMPFLWSAVFFLLDQTSVVAGGIGVFGRARRRLEHLISDLCPEIVVSVYPGYGHLLDLVRCSNRSLRFVTVVTDSLSVNSVWFRCGSEYFLVPNEATAGVMRGAGVAAERLRVTGFPVPLVFSLPPPDRGGRPPFRVLLMVNSAHHLAPAVVRELLKVDGIQLTATVGRDAALGRTLEAVARETGREIEIHGWTPQIPDLIRRSHLLISKAGGATVQEALAARTPMIVTQVVPGQEEGNARLLIESGAGELATTPAAIAKAVRRTFADGAAIYHRRFAATAALSHPDASRAAANFLETLA